MIALLNNRFQGLERVVKNVLVLPENKLRETDNQTHNGTITVIKMKCKTYFQTISRSFAVFSHQTLKLSNRF
jgi:hypothetical protein